MSPNLTIDQNIETNRLPLPSEPVSEVSKKMLTHSIEVGREFCKYMLTLSVIAVPVYLGLLMIALPYDADKGVTRGLALLVPGLIFLSSTTAFATGYCVDTRCLFPEAIYEAERTRVKIVRHRAKLLKLGFVLFLLGVITAMTVIVKAHL